MMNKNQHSNISKIEERAHGKITALYERSAYPNPENIRRQRNNLATYASNKGFQNLRHYTDDGFAGTDTDRPAFNQLMEDIHNEKIGILIVHDLARLTRKIEALSDFTNELDLHGVRLIALNECMDRLPLFIIDEHSGLRCELHGDYYFPVLLDPEEEDEEPLGRWGLMAKQHMEEYHPGRFSRLLLTGKLMDHLRDIDREANEQFESMMAAYKQKWNITEALKAEDPMRWVGLMNNARNEVEWFITKELIFN